MVMWQLLCCAGHMVVLWHCCCTGSIKDGFVGPGILQAAPEESHTLPSKGRAAECMTLLGSLEVSTWFPDCEVGSEDFHCVLVDGGFGCVCVCVNLP